MPRFYFHLKDDRFTADQTGEALQNAEAAARATLRIGADVLRDRSGTPGTGELLGVICTDENGDVVAAVLVTRPPIETARGMLEAWGRGAAVTPESPASHSPM